MPLHALGLNHQSAPLALRERVAFAGAQLDDALQALRAVPGVEEIAVLSTCNRTEVYAVAAGDALPVADWLARHAAGTSDLHDYLYLHSEADAARHLFRVATGLDSMVLGEPQILGQVKQCWSDAREAGTLGPRLDRLFQHAFATAKRARTETAVGSNPVSVASTAVRLARETFSRTEDANVLLVGAGETIELVARHLGKGRVKGLLVTNRTLAHAQALASEYGGMALPLDALPQHLDAADIVFTATASQTPVIHAQAVAQALKSRKQRPMLFLDLAVPRDVDADVAALPNAYVYTVDDLQRLVEENRRNRQDAATAAETIIDLQVDRYMDVLALGREGQGAIRQLREHAERHRQDALQRARAQLAAGQSAEQVLEQLAHQLTNRLMHAPTTALRHAVVHHETQLVDAVSRLFPAMNEDHAAEPPQET